MASQKSNRTVLGIDPGKNGGVCAYLNGELTMHKMPETIYDIVALFRVCCSECFFQDHQPVAFIENPPISMGPDKGAASVKLHANHGILRGALVALGYRLEEPRPQEWQKTFHLGTRSSCASDTVWKNKLKSEAQRIYPHMKITHSVSDALLILTFGLSKLKIEV